LPVSLICLVLIGGQAILTVEVRFSLKTEAKKATKPTSGVQRYYSRAVGNALSIFELLQMSDRPLALAEIARQMSLPKSSVFRTLCTLEIDSYIHRREDDRFSIAHGAGSSPQRMVRRVVEASEAAMKALSQEFRETISLAFVFDNRIEVVAVIDSPHRVSMGNRVGDMIPPHASSLGKCLTALQGEGHRSRLLRGFSMVRYTLHTTTDESVLYKEFDLVRARGYATDIEESVVGGCCLSAPIFALQGRAVAALSISMPKMRFAHQKRMVSALKDAAAAAAKTLAKSV
jgi:DNA-binding IclR family transcriptional regulator